jgi:HAD domain in Swiss Army Knife RNA repair proteins
VTSLLFLDVDGVLNHARTRFDLSEPRGGLEPDLLDAVGRLVRETDARVVISSMWRVVFPLDELREKLAPEIPPAFVIGATPDLFRATRGQEIAAWLRAHRTPTRLAILDDNDRNMFDMAPVRRWLVQTDGAVGVTADDLQQARRLLLRGPVCDASTLGVAVPRRHRRRHRVSPQARGRLFRMAHVAE